MNINLLHTRQATRTHTCILVLDISGSMQRPAGDTQQRRIDELNQGVQALFHSLLSEEAAVKRFEIAIVTVGGPNNAATLTQNFATVGSFSVPTFTAVGGTPLGAGVQLALDALESRCELLKRNSQSASRPMMFVLSDGEPTDAEDDWKLASRRSREAEHKGNCSIYSFLVYGATNPRLDELSTVNPVESLAQAAANSFVRFSFTTARKISAGSDAVAARQLQDAAAWFGDDPRLQPAADDEQRHRVAEEAALKAPVRNKEQSKRETQERLDAERRATAPESPPAQSPESERPLKPSFLNWFRAKWRPSSAPSSPGARHTNIRILDGDRGAIAMTKALRARHTYTLEVSIKVKRDVDSLTAGRKDQASVHVKDQRETVWVWVVLTDETDGDAAFIEDKLFDLDRRYGALKLPVTGDSEGAVSFRFLARPPPGVLLDRPRKEVCPRIGIRIYHKLNLIDHTQLEFRFTEQEAPLLLGKHDPAVSVKFMQVDGRPVEAPDPASAARALTISISKPDPEAAHYRFALVAGSRTRAGEPGLFASRKLSFDELDGFVSDFRDILLQAVFERSLSSVDLSGTDQQEVLSSLAALGDRIVASLFNYSQQGDLFEWSEMLREVLPQVSIIQIALGQGAQELVFPWQILTLEPSSDPDAPVDPRNLWGYRFIIEVKRCGDGVDSRPLPARRPDTARVTYARWSFQNESTHYARLKEIVSKSKFPAAIAQPIVESRAPFADALLNGGGELLYIYAHGHAAAPNTALGIRHRTAARTWISELRKKLEASPGLAGNDLQAARRVQDQFLKLTRADGGSSLSLNNSDVELTYLLTQTSRARARLTDAPIVFMNTCESAQVWNALSDSFVAFFLDRGARAVLGTESTIPIVVADVFGQAVLESLFQGNALGEAVHAARWALLNKHRNPLGLCYCLYGAADARLSSKAI